MVRLQICCLLMDGYADGYSQPYSYGYRPGFLFSDARLRVLNQKSLNILYPLDNIDIPSRLLMKGVHDLHISDARPRQTDIHILLRKFSLNKAAGSCSGFYGLWYL